MNIDPSGGQGIGPDATGHDYPLVAPESDMVGVLADFYLAHPGSAPLPLSIAWLSGMNLAYNGAVMTPANSGSGTGYTPTHAADVVVVDANGDVVFNSTGASSFQQGAFSDRLYSYEWADGVSVCRLIQNSAISSPSWFRPRPAQIWPVDGRLDERCSEVMPSRLLELQSLPGAVELIGGYNVTLTSTSQTIGLRSGTLIEISAEAGTGLGRQPGCESVELTIDSIDGSTADANGNLSLAATGCYWVRPPISGDATVAATLAIGNDCGPCCDCADYTKVAAAIVAAFAQLEALGTAATQLACQFAGLVARWEAQQTCRESATVKLNAVAFGTYIQAAVQVCNASTTCLDSVTLSVAFSSTATVSVVSGTSVVNDGMGNTSAGSPGSTAGAASFHFGLVAPQTAVTANFRLAVTGESGATPVTLTASATASGTTLPGTATRIVTTGS